MKQTNKQIESDALPTEPPRHPWFCNAQSTTTVKSGWNLLFFFFLFYTTTSQILKHNETASMKETHIIKSLKSVKLKRQQLRGLCLRWAIKFRNAADTSLWHESRLEVKYPIRGRHNTKDLIFIYKVFDNTTPKFVETYFGSGSLRLTSR